MLRIGGGGQLNCGTGYLELWNELDDGVVDRVGTESGNLTLFWNALRMNGDGGGGGGDVRHGGGP